MHYHVNKINYYPMGDLFTIYVFYALCAKSCVMCIYPADWCSHRFLKTKSLVGLEKSSVVKSTSCSHRGPKFGFWNPHGGGFYCL